MAPLWRRFLAQLVVAAPDHLPVPCADREKFVKRIHDSRVRERVAYLADQVVTKMEGMLEMHDIRSDSFQERAEMLGVKILICDRAVDVIELVAVRVEKVLIGACSNGRDVGSHMRAVTRADRGSPFR